jgi:transcriptional regulator with XRE-family HTH domain
MTIRRRNSARNSEDRLALKEIGATVKRHRKELTLNPPTRAEFINSGADFGLSPYWITEKSLANIENGLNMPSLRTLHTLSIALQIEPETLFAEVSAAFSPRQENSDEHDHSKQYEQQ